jgi:hypothetical protein
MMNQLELGFAIKGYPGTGRKTEAEVDLTSCDRFDLIQGAFMGDMAFKTADMDFSSRFGWVTLIGWMLSLSETLRQLAVSRSHTLRFAESDDFMSFRQHDDVVYVACSYLHGIGYVSATRLSVVIRAFIEDQLAWISLNYPAALRNPAMDGVVDLLS